MNSVPEYFGAVPLAPLEGATDYHLIARVTHFFEHVCEFFATQLVDVIFMPVLCRGDYGKHFGNIFESGRLVINCLVVWYTELILFSALKVVHASYKNTIFGIKSHGW